MKFSDARVGPATAGGERPAKDVIDAVPQALHALMFDSSKPIGCGLRECNYGAGAIVTTISGDVDGSFEVQAIVDYRIHPQLKDHALLLAAALRGLADEIEQKVRGSQ